MAAQCAPSTYTRSVIPLGNGYGIVSVIDTEPDTSGLYVNRYVSGSAISSAFMFGSGYRINGALLDYGTEPGGANANDIIGFNLLIDPLNPDTLTIWRNLIGNIDSFAMNNVRSFGMGGVTQNSGLVAIRLDGYSGGIGGNGIGILKVDAPTTTTFMDYSDTQYFTLLGYGISSGDILAVPSIGEHNNLVVSSSFDNFMGAFRPDITSNSIVTDPHGQFLTPMPTEGRGSAAINDAAGVIAGVTAVTEPSDPTPNKGEHFRLRVIKYQDNGGPISKTDERTYSFRNPGDGNSYAFANFFSQTAYRGPQQISINDNGDIALPVVINVQGNSSDDGPYRYAMRRGILFMSHNQPGVFKCVVDNAIDNALVFYDDRSDSSPARYAPAIGGVAVDNDGNVFFSATNWMGKWGGDIKSTNAIYKASVSERDAAGNPIKWSTEPIIWRGSTWVDGDNTCEISILPLGNSDAEWFANPAAFGCQNINRTKLPSKNDPRYSCGGIFFGAGVGVSNTDGNTMRGLYLTPTEQRPATSNIYTSKKLDANQPINLTNCVIVGLAGTYIPSGSTRVYYRYLVSDSSHARIVVSTIRPPRPDDVNADPNNENRFGLAVGDRISVSGYVNKNTDANDSYLAVDEKYLSSSGLILVKRGADLPKPIGMNNRSIGSGNGLDTTGMWVRAFGTIQSIDTTNKKMVISDGSDVPVQVEYGSYTIPQLKNGDHIVVSGDIVTGDQKIVRMRAGDSITKY
jgi:hypothetical protein